MEGFKFKKPNPKVGMAHVQASPLNLKLLEQLAYNRGFNEGVTQQREKDIQTLVDLLNGIEDVPGFGPKTVEKIQKHFLDKFGWES